MVAQKGENNHRERSVFIQGCLENQPTLGRTKIIQFEDEYDYFNETSKSSF